MNTSRPSPDHDPGPRQLRKAVLEIVTFSVTASLIGLWIIGFPLPNIRLDQLWERSTMAGAAAMDHIGTTLSVYAGSLLAFYGVVIGAKVSRSSAALRTQRFLGFTSEIMTGALAPTLILMVIACIDHPSTAGALFPLVPVIGLVFVVATVLGTFLVFSNAERIESLTKSLGQVRVTRRALPRASRNPPLTFCGHIITMVILGVGITAVLNQINGNYIPTANLAVIGAVYITVTAVVSLGSALGIETMQTSMDAMNKTTGVIVIVLMSTAGLFFAITLLAAGIWPVAIAVESTFLLTLFSTLGVGKAGPRWIATGTINGAAACIAYRSLTKQIHRIEGELSKLEQEAPASGNKT